MTASNDIPERTRLFSEDLVGLEGPECTESRCPAPGHMKCTGWLEFVGFYDEPEEWWLEFECPEHGIALAKVFRHEDRVRDALAANGIEFRGW